jgi:hypothetical protein
VANAVDTDCRSNPTVDFSSCALLAYFELNPTITSDVDALGIVARGEKKDGGDEKGLSLEIETNILSSRATDLS